MGKDDKPCEKERCADYNCEKRVCNLLVSLQPLRLESSPEERAVQTTKRRASIGELLELRPCEFSKYIDKIAAIRLRNRGLNAQYSEDIRSVVIIMLMKLDFRPIKPTYNDFRRYLISVIESAIDKEFKKGHGKYRCGTCIFFSGSDRCSCHDINPLPGHSYVEVTSRLKPEEVVHASTHSIVIDDIRDWSGFCSKLCRDGYSTNQVPGKRVWELLAKDAREAVQEVARLNGRGRVHYPAIVEALDEILRDEAFYQEMYFRNIQLSEEAEILFERGLANLSKNEVRRINRLLLEAAYPREIVRSTRGCSNYTARRFVSIDFLVDANNFACVEQPQSDQFESALKYLESRGPRQSEQAELIRLKSRGDELAEIAKRMGKHPNTISKDYWGTNEEDEDGGAYHQAGACDCFGAIYSGAYFDLERSEEQLWAVVHERDFSAYRSLPSFKKIARKFSISKREAIERYVRGWNWIDSQITRGGKGMPKMEDDGSQGEPGPQGPATHTAKSGEMLHPDYYALLTYAEDALDREARKIIAGHVLVCGYCSTELEHIEMEILPATEPPLTPAERLQTLAARLIGWMRDLSSGSSTEIPRGNPWPLSARLAFGLTVVAMAALLSAWAISEIHQDRLADRLYAEQKELEGKIDALQEQAQKTAAVDEEAQRLRDELKELKRNLNQLRDERGAPEELPKPDIATPDIDGVTIVGGDVRIEMGEDGSAPKTYILPPPVANPVRELLTSRFVTPAESTRSILGLIRRRGEPTTEEITRGGAGEPTPSPLSPNRTAVRSTRLTLRWKAVPDAQSYEIKIDDLTQPDQEPITPEGIKETHFSVDTGKLRPGHIYRWFVVAKIPNASQRPSFAVKFWVLDEQSMREVEGVENAYPEAPLVHAGVYVKYGLYEEAKEALEQVKKRNPNSKDLKKVLKSLDRQWSGK